MSRRVVDHVLALRESHGFLRGLVGLVGFEQTSPVRPRFAGLRQEQVQPFLGLAGDRAQRGHRLLAVPAASQLAAGHRAGGVRVPAGLVYLGLKLGGVEFPIGNPTIVIVVSFFSGIQLLSLG